MDAAGENFFSEEELLPLSALQHFVFCRRQCALIHVEQVWTENLHTAEGRLMHKHVETASGRLKRDVRVEYSVPLRSYKLGLVGKADVVEFRTQSNSLVPFPIEYKRGRPKVEPSDEVQLCAQAMCLEEMMGVAVKEGAIFYGKIRRRQEVVFDEGLRRMTEETALRVHAMIRNGEIPPPEYGKKCGSCSLVNLCMPNISGREKKVRRYIDRLTREA